MSMTKWVVFGAALALAGCGDDAPDAPRGPVMAPLESPDHLSAAAHTASGLPAGFGDTNPHPWAGRTPADYAVHGIDAARYQGVIDWNAARASGVRFAWLKATEGGDRVDPAFEINHDAAAAAGVAVGAYHFYYFCRSAEEQARWFIENVPRQEGGLPPVLDMEWNHTSPTCQKRPPALEVRREMHVFLDALTAHYGTPPVIYTTIDFWRDNDLGKLGNYDLWLRTTTAHPAERYPGTRWTFWQYSGTGVVPGVGGNADLNAFAGSEGAWQTWLERRAQE